MKSSSSTLALPTETPRPAKRATLADVLRLAEQRGLTGPAYRRLWASACRQSAEAVVAQAQARQEQGDAFIAAIAAEQDRRRSDPDLNLKQTKAPNAGPPELPAGWSAEEVAAREEVEARERAARRAAGAEAEARVVPEALAMLDGRVPDPQTEDAGQWFTYAVWRGETTGAWWRADSAIGEAFQDRTRLAGATARRFEEALTALAALDQEPRFARLDHRRGVRAWWLISRAQTWVDRGRVATIEGGLILGALPEAERPQALGDVRGVVRGTNLPALRWKVWPPLVATFFGDLLEREAATLRRACPWLVREFDDELGVGELPEL